MQSEIENETRKKADSEEKEEIQSEKHKTEKVTG